MKGIAAESVDMILTSPPYDGLRDYHGFTFDAEAIAVELFRVLKEGGICVWVVGDAVVGGSETGTSFEQALTFKRIGFRLHDTMIYERTPAYPASAASNRYSQAFEYMFIFSKGKPKTTNLIKDRKNKWGGSTSWGTQSERLKDGSLKTREVIQVQEFGYRFNIWNYATGRGQTTLDEEAWEHPAMFPEALATDHILSWSNQGDTVLDPMNGSGTTTKVAHKLGRDFIGIDVSERYCEIARNRVQQQTLV